MSDYDKEAMHFTRDLSAVIALRDELQHREPGSGTFMRLIAAAAMEAHGEDLRSLEAGFPAMALAIRVWRKYGFDYLDAVARDDEADIVAAYEDYQDRVLAGE